VSVQVSPGHLKRGKKDNSGYTAYFSSS
jgi:hypothetical protein